MDILRQKDELVALSLYTYETEVSKKNVLRISISFTDEKSRLPPNWGSTLQENLSKKVKGKTTWIVVTSDPQYDKMYPVSTSPKITFLDIKSNHNRTTSHEAATQAIAEMKAILTTSRIFGEVESTITYTSNL